MTPTQGFFESEADYKSRVAKEADERTIEESTGESPSQKFFESDESYRDRISRDATEKRITEAGGSAPSQGFFEDVDSYRSRIEREANERTVERASGSVPSPGFFEKRTDYEVRVRKEANEHTLRDSGSSPRQGFFEGDHAYRSRVAHEARETRADQSPPFGCSDAPSVSRRSGGVSGRATPRSVSSSSSVVWSVIVTFIVVFAAWQWLQSSRSAALARSRVAESVAAATEAANRHDFDRAEHLFEQALTAAAHFDAAFVTEIDNRKSALYQGIPLPGNSSVTFQPVGKFVWHFDDPFMCQRHPSKCGFRFVSLDSRGLFTSHSAVTVRLGDGRDLPVTSGMRISDLVPLGVEICCAQSHDDAAPKLTLHNRRPESIVVYVANR